VIEGDVGAFNSKHRTFTQDWSHAIVALSPVRVRTGTQQQPKLKNEEGRIGI
jgi:hypothetical protein